MSSLFVLDNRARLWEISGSVRPWASRAEFLTSVVVMAATGESADAGIGVPARKYERRRKTVRWSQKVADRLCRRVAGGELLHTVLREPGWPTATSLAKWVRARPAFGHALTEARKASGRCARGGGVLTYNDGVAEEVFDRLCAGETLSQISADPLMPSMKTLFNWRRRFAAFDELVLLGQRVQAERYCDQGVEIAAEITPQTAYATHVRLTHLRWTTMAIAPRQFRLKAVEPPGEARRMEVVMRRFSAEVHPETGERRMVTWDVDPATGEVTQTWSEHALQGIYKG